MVAVEEHLEEIHAVVLSVPSAVVALGLEHRIERVVGGVVGAGLADRLELAVELRGPVAPAVAEHAPLVFDRELGHGG